MDKLRAAGFSKEEVHAIVKDAVGELYAEAITASNQEGRRIATPMLQAEANTHNNLFEQARKLLAQPSLPLRQPQLTTQETLTLWTIQGTLEISPPENRTAETASVRRTPMEIEWEGLKEKLIETRTMKREIIGQEKEIFGKLDTFLNKYGEEGTKIAGGFPRAVANMRSSYDKSAKYDALFNECEEMRNRLRILEIEKEQFDILKEEKETRARLEEFKEKTKREAAELQRQMTAVLQRKQDAGLTLPHESKPHPERTCPICNLEGVVRGRDCPNRTNHPGYVPHSYYKN